MFKPETREKLTKFRSLFSLEAHKGSEINRMHINHDTATNVHSKEHEENDATGTKEGLCFVHFQNGI